MVQNEMLQNTPASGLHVEAEAAVQETAAQRTALSSRNGEAAVRSMEWIGDLSRLKSTA
jgi:hypothetical protein